MPKKTPKDYAIEAAEKRLKMRDCKHCGQRVWGGFADYSWVFMDPVNLSPPEEARFMAAGVPTWEVRLVGREGWFVDYRMKWHLDMEKKRGHRYIVYPSHICRTQPQPRR